MDAAAFVRAQIDALRAAHPDLLDDEETAAIVLEGETDFLEVLDRLVEGIAEAESDEEAIAGRMRVLAERKNRFGEKAEHMRGVVSALLDFAGQTKVKLPVATISLRASPPRVVVIDETEIPEQFIRTRREVDKAALREALKAGDDIPGAALSNSAPSLTIRRG